MRCGTKTGSSKDLSGTMMGQKPFDLLIKPDLLNDFMLSYEVTAV